MQEVLNKAAPFISGSPPRELNMLLVAGPKDHGPGEHDYPAWQKAWKPLLEKSEAVKVDTAFKWPTKEQWEAARIAAFFLANEWTEAQLRDVDEFLARGGGVVLIHMSVIPKGDAAPLAARIGLAWQHRKTKYRHGHLELKIASPDDPIVRGLPEKIRFVDESYWPLVEGDMKQVTVLATAVEDGAAQPMVWTRSPEKGRVFCSILGHYSWSLDDPFFRLLLLRGISWAAGEHVHRLDALATDGVALRNDPAVVRDERAGAGIQRE